MEDNEKIRAETNEKDHRKAHTKQNLFATEEDEEDNRQFSHDESEKNEDIIRAEKREPKKRNNVSNGNKPEKMKKDLIIKSRNKLMGPINLTNEIGMDQIRFEKLIMDENDEEFKMLEIVSHEKVERFDKFLRQNSQTNENRNILMNQNIMKQINIRKR